MKEKFYDTKLKLNIVGYKPTYLRLIVKAPDISSAREAALIVANSAYKEEKKEFNLKIEVVKCNYQKINGVIGANKVMIKHQEEKKSN